MREEMLTEQRARLAGVVTVWTLKALLARVHRLLVPCRVALCFEALTTDRALEVLFLIVSLRAIKTFVL